MSAIRFKRFVVAPAALLLLACLSSAAHSYGSCIRLLGYRAESRGVTVFVRNPECFPVKAIVGATAVATDGSTVAGTSNVYLVARQTQGVLVHFPKEIARVGTTYVTPK